LPSRSRRAASILS